MVVLRVILNGSSELFPFLPLPSPLPFSSPPSPWILQLPGLPSREKSILEEENWFRNHQFLYFFPIFREMNKGETGG